MTMSMRDCLLVHIRVSSICAAAAANASVRAGN